LTDIGAGSLPSDRRSDGGQRPARLRGLRAAAAHARYFRDPIDCMAALHRRYGRFFAVGEVLPVGYERLHFLAADPEINRQVFPRLPVVSA
jgi:hypothetical protein